MLDAMSKTVPLQIQFKFHMKFKESRYWKFFQLYIFQDLKGMLPNNNHVYLISISL